MPIGTGATTLQNIPAQPFVTDPNAFFQMTTKNVSTPSSFASPGAGKFNRVQLQQAGIISKLLLKFEGTLNVATAAATTSDLWPYGFLRQFKLSANGQNDLFNCNGIDLHNRRFVQFPAYRDMTDVFTSKVGGGDSVAVGSTAVSLTFEVPIAIDDTSLVGALFAQSSSSNFVIEVTEANMSDLFSTNPGNATLSGTWYVQSTFFDIPIANDGNLIVPDLSRLHGINAVDVPFANTGEVRCPLIRSAGQLERLFISARSSAANRLSAAPNAAASKKIDALRLEYGGNKRPYVINPASFLVSLNNDHYGAPVPFDAVVLDFIKENPVRDTILMQGITELAAVLSVNSGVSVTAGSAHVVQETLF